MTSRERCQALLWEYQASAAMDNEDVSYWELVIWISKHILPVGPLLYLGPILRRRREKASWGENGVYRCWTNASYLDPLPPEIIRLPLP